MAPGSRRPLPLPCSRKHWLLKPLVPLKTVGDRVPRWGPPAGLQSSPRAPAVWAAAVHSVNQPIYQRDVTCFPFLIVLGNGDRPLALRKLLTAEQ